MTTASAAAGDTFTPIPDGDLLGAELIIMLAIVCLIALAVDARRPGTWW